MNDPQFDPVDPQQKPIESGFGLEPPPKQRGCFFYGCIIALVLLVLGAICMAAVGYMAWSYYVNMINTYTATAPAQLPAVKISDEDRKALDERVDAFKKALDAGDGGELILTADDLNALISENKDFAGTVYVTLKDDQVSAQVSYPLDKIPAPMTKGRYLNGSGTFTAQIVDGELIVHLQDLEVNGKKLPPEIKTQFQRENLAKSANDDANMYRYIRKFESLKVKDGKVHIKAKARSKDESTEETEKPKTGDSPKEESKPDDKPQDKPAAKPDEKPQDKATPKTDDKPQDKPAAKPDDKPEDKPAPKTEEVKKAA
jgi:hypothetical protein